MSFIKLPLLRVGWFFTNELDTLPAFLDEPKDFFPVAFLVETGMRRVLLKSCLAILFSLRPLSVVLKIGCFWPAPTVLLREVGLAITVPVAEELAVPWIEEVVMPTVLLVKVSSSVAAIPSLI